MEGRTYRYFQGEPLFPFGYGLSYTTFQFDNLHVDRQKVQAEGTVVVGVDVTNSGDRAGDEVVQLYVHHRDATVPRPIKELKGFKRVTLQPGERKTVTFTLYVNQLGIYDRAMQYVVEPGMVEVMVGNSSQHLPLTGTFEIVGQTTDIGEKNFFSDVRID
jgi:beta-glucosidase